MTQEHPAPRTRGRVVRRLVAAAATIGVTTIGVLALTVTAASADAPDVATAVASHVTVNADHSITVRLVGTWTWTTHGTDCNADRFAAGWAADWNDPNAPGNHVTTLGTDSIDVGVARANPYNAADNHVRYYGDAPRCGTVGNGHPSGDLGERPDQTAGTTGATGFLEHTYAPGTTHVDPCVLMYDVHNVDDPKELTAGGAGHNEDNSAEKNDQTPAGNVCAPVALPPDVSVVKTGPATATVG